MIKIMDFLILYGKQQSCNVEVGSRLTDEDCHGLVYLDRLYPPGKGSRHLTLIKSAKCGKGNRNPNN